MLTWVLIAGLLILGAVIVGLALSNQDKLQQIHALHARHTQEMAIVTKVQAEHTQQALELWKKENLPKIREEAIAASKRVTRGQITEHTVPFLVQGANPKDYHFLGNPIDYVVFKGMTDEEPIEVVFLEVKTGESRMNKHQRKVRDAIKEGRVRFVSFNPDQEK